MKKDHLKKMTGNAKSESVLHSWICLAHYPSLA